MRFKIVNAAENHFCNIYLLNIYTYRKMENKNLISLLIILLHDLHGKNGFAEILI